MAPVPPSLTHEQRVAASQAAVANRRRRAEVKKMVKSGELSLSELFELADREECVAQMRAYDLISALPAIGEVKAARIMKSASIAQTRGAGTRGAQTSVEFLHRPIRVLLSKFVNRRIVCRGKFRQFRRNGAALGNLHVNLHGVP